MIDKIKISLLAVCFFCMLTTTGCKILPESQGVDSVDDCYYIKPGVRFNSIGKVVILEPSDLSYCGSLSEDLVELLAQELRKRHSFSVATVKENSQSWLDLENIKDGNYDYEKIATIRRELNSNAVIFGIISQYRPFPKMTIGLRLRMLDLRTGKIIWGIEQVWDTTDRRMQQKMECYFETSMRKGYDPIGPELLEVSPKAFYKFVASEVAQTIPSSSCRW